MTHKSLIAGFALIALAGSVTVSTAQISVGPGLRIAPPTRSLKALRDQNVVKQRFDFSCGAAALATMLRYGYDDEVTEQQILADLFHQLSEQDKQTARDLGFSLLDLQRVAKTRGYAAEGFRLEPQQLPMLGGPVIAYIEPRGYKHFVVLRGVRGDRVYLADPSLGNIRMPIYAFLDSWLRDDGRGIIFVVEPKSGLPGNGPLTLAGGNPQLPPPEIMAAREMLTVRSSLLRSPAGSRQR